MLAEDAAQDAFVRAYRALDRYDPTQPFSAWVVGIARNHCIDLLRRRRHGELRFGDEAAELAAAEAESIEGVDALVINERGGKVRAALAALPDKYRLPLVLAYYNEASYDEIAERSAFHAITSAYCCCAASRHCERRSRPLRSIPNEPSR